MTPWLRLLKDGSISFDRFVRETAKDWRLLAHYVWRRWRLPEAVEVSDVEQEMLVAAWRAVERWRPDGGQPIAKYVVFSATAAAKDWLHKQREAHKRRGSSPSRHPIAEARIGRGETSLVERIVDEPTQEEALVIKEMAGLASARCRTTRDEYCVAAVVEGGGTVEGAVDWLWMDAAIRRRCRLNSKADARRAIWRAASKLTA